MLKNTGFFAVAQNDKRVAQNDKMPQMTRCLVMTEYLKRREASRTRKASDDRKECTLGTRLRRSDA